MTSPLFPCTICGQPVPLDNSVRQGFISEMGGPPAELSLARKDTHVFPVEGVCPGDPATAARYGPNPHILEETMMEITPSGLPGGQAPY